MSNLTKEAIEAIEKKHLSLIECTPHKDDYKYGMIEALTNPTIYQAAGLMSVDESLRFAEWVCNENGQIATISEQLLTIFRNQKEVK